MGGSSVEKLKIHGQVPLVFNQIFRKDWKNVRRTISLHESMAAECTGSCKKECGAKHTILHYACQFRPPLDVIKILYHAHPQVIFEKDCKGRYALHIACKHGCSPDVVSYLLHKNPDAAGEADIKDRTPLLLAFKSYIFECQLPWRMANKSLAEVTKALTRAAPSVINQEDNSGLTALEYGLEEEFDMSTMMILQNATKGIEKEKRKSSLLATNQ